MPHDESASDDEPGPLGLVLTLGVIAVLGVGWTGLIAPRGMDAAASGVIVALGVTESDFGTLPQASVQAPDRVVQLPLPRASFCRVGDRVALIRRRTGLGYRYRVAPQACR